MNISLTNVKNGGIVSSKNFGYGGGYSGFVFTRNTY